MNLAENDPYAASDFLIQQDDGTFRVGGCLPRKWKPEDSPFKPWGSNSSVPMVPKSEWALFADSVRAFQRRTMNQNGYPACCLASLANAMELAMVRDGRPYKKLDWLAAYKALNPRMRGGVALDVAAAYAMDKGFPIEGGGVVKIAEAWDCPSPDALMSGLLRGGIGTFGHDVHAECAAQPAQKNGRWGFDTLNSWDEWGEQGPTGFWGWHFIALEEVEMQYGIILIREVELIA